MRPDIVVDGQGAPGPGRWWVDYRHPPTGRRARVQPRGGGLEVRVRPGDDRPDELVVWLPDAAAGQLVRVVRACLERGPFADACAAAAALLPGGEIVAATAGQARIRGRRATDAADTWRVRLL